MSLILCNIWSYIFRNLQNQNCKKVICECRDSRVSDQSNCPDFVPFDSAGTPLSAQKISTGCGLHLPGSPPGICAAWRLSGAGSSVSGWSPNPPAAPQTVHLVLQAGRFALWGVGPVRRTNILLGLDLGLVMARAECGCSDCWSRPQWCGLCEVWHYPAGTQLLECPSMAGHAVARCPGCTVPLLGCLGLEPADSCLCCWWLPKRWRHHRHEEAPHPRTEPHIAHHAVGKPVFFRRGSAAGIWTRHWTKHVANSSWESRPDVGLTTASWPGGGVSSAHSLGRVDKPSTQLREYGFSLSACWSSGCQAVPEQLIGLTGNDCEDGETEWNDLVLASSPVVGLTSGHQLWSQIPEPTYGALWHFRACATPACLWPACKRPIAFSLAAARSGGIASSSSKPLH